MELNEHEGRYYRGAINSTAVSYSSHRFLVTPTRTDELTMLEPVRFFLTLCNRTTSNP